MSRTLSLTCETCKKRLWIGQRSHLYKTEEYLKKIEKFLLKHESGLDLKHELGFYDDDFNQEWYSTEEWEDAEDV